MRTIDHSIEGLAAADQRAFRSVFAAEDERLMLVLIGKDAAASPAAVIRAVGDLSRRRAKVAVLLHGEIGGFRPPEVPGVRVLEDWALPLLPSVSRVADLVLRVGRPLADAKSLERPPLLVPEGLDRGALENLLGRALGLAPSERGEDQSPRSQGLGSVVLFNDWGIGDELLLSAVAREIVRAYPALGVWIRSRHGFRFPSFVQTGPIPSDARAVEVIYQNPTLYSPHAHSPFPRHLVQQMLDKFALDTGLRVKALDVRPELEMGPHAGPRQRRVIVHSRPNARLSSKDWGNWRWQKLADLLRAGGVEVVQVGSKDEPLLDGVEDLRGTPVGKLPEVFLEAGAVVCVVGLLMHLAEATRTPAVVIYGGRETPAIDGYPDQVHLSSGPLPCRGRWGCHLGPDLSCPHAMLCMEGITPELVARETVATLAGGGPR
jgi:hypothetical protein